MATVTELDLKELKDFISQQFEQVNSKLNELAIGQARLEARVSGLEKWVDDMNNRVNDMNNQVNDMSNRLNIMTVGFLSILGVFMTGMLTIIGKLVFFPNP
jgi:uncharacterized protein YlxW (UPF0749 family)